MFINISNHASSKWSPEQLAAAGGTVTDLPFPNICPRATPEAVHEIAREVLTEVLTRFPERGTALVQGEFALCSELWRMLSVSGWKIVVATSERVSVDNGDGTKTARFDFVQFREIRGF